MNCEISLFLKQMDWSGRVLNIISNDTEKCRFTSRGFVVSCCSENEIVVHDSDWYYRKVSVDDSKKNVIANGKTYPELFMDQYSTK